MPHPVFDHTDHRPWPVPPHSWRWRQSWLDVLFAHWPTPAESLRPLIPEALTIEEFDGTAWLGVVPFRMEGVGLRGVPNLPWLSAFPELNVRTYVEAEGKPGVWFFSLDAANAVAVWTARRFFHLPYYRADMSVEPAAAELVYRSRRLTNNGRAARFSARYGPVSDVRPSTPGSLDHWLMERYCLYSRAPDGRVCRADVHHHPWALQPADAEIELNTMTHPLGISLPDQPPILHYSKRLDIVAWAPVPLVHPLRATGVSLR